MAKQKLPKEVERIVKDIKSLKIQGARNVAKATIKAFLLYLKWLQKNRKRKKKAFSEYRKPLIEDAIKVLLELSLTRPTEPMTRNIFEEIVNYTFFLVEKFEDEEKIIEKLLKKQEEILKKMEERVKILANIGANYLPEKATVITYCHSSTVVAILKQAKKLGKEIEVIACETRPLYQGRITALELAKAGIKTTLIVDGALGRFMKKADLALVGGDAITSAGDLVNKIGTLTLARVAESYGKSLFSAVELYKFDRQSIFGFREPIEQRDPKEVWTNPPKLKSLSIANYAFDVIPARLINAYITDVGIITPQNIAERFEEYVEKQLKLY